MIHALSRSLSALTLACLYHATPTLASPTDALLATVRVPDAIHLEIDPDSPIMSHLLSEISQRPWSGITDGIEVQGASATSLRFSSISWQVDLGKVEWIIRDDRTTQIQVEIEGAKIHIPEITIRRTVAGIAVSTTCRPLDLALDSSAKAHVIWTLTENESSPSRPDSDVELYWESSGVHTESPKECTGSAGVGRVIRQWIELELRSVRARIESILRAQMDRAIRQIVDLVAQHLRQQIWKVTIAVPQPRGVELRLAWERWRIEQKKMVGVLSVELVLLDDPPDLPPPGLPSRGQSYSNIANIRVPLRTINLLLEQLWPMFRTTTAMSLATVRNTWAVGLGDLHHPRHDPCSFAMSAYLRESPQMRSPQGNTAVIASGAFHLDLLRQCPDEHASIFGQAFGRLSIPLALDPIATPWQVTVPVNPELDIDGLVLSDDLRVEDRSLDREGLALALSAALGILRHSGPLHLQPPAPWHLGAGLSLTPHAPWMTGSDLVVGVGLEATE